MTTFRASFVSIVTVLATLVSGINSLTAAELHGIVLDTNGEPIAGARVVVLTSEGQAEVASNADGTFTIDRPAGRAPLLIATADGRM